MDILFNPTIELVTEICESEKHNADDKGCYPSCPPCIPCYPDA